MAWTGLQLVMTSSMPAAIMRSDCSGLIVDLEFVENGFSFGILLFFSQVKDLRFPPVPGFHLNELIENAFAHWPVAVIFRLDSGLSLSISGNSQSF